MTNEKRQWYLIFSLLAAVVILPSVTMLWFVSRAAENEQLAIRQRLTDKYSAEVKAEFFLNLPEQLNASSEKVAQLYRQCVSADKAITSAGLSADGTIFDAVVLYTNSGYIAEPGVKNLVSPLFADELADPLFTTAIGLEFRAGDYPAAIEQYRLVADTHKHLAQASLLAQVRCLRKAGQLKDAIDTCLELLNSLDYEAGNENIWHLRLMLTEMYAQTGRSELDGSLRNLAEISQYPVSNSLKVFILETIVKLGYSSPEVASELKYANTLMEICDKYPTLPTGTITLESGKYFVMPINQHIDGILPCCFVSKERMVEVLSDITEQLSDEMVFVNVIGPDNELIAGENISPIEDILGRMQIPKTIFNYPLSQTPLGADYDLWLAFRPEVFGPAAQMYKNAYLWGAIMILMVAGTGGFLVVKMLASQLRVNRLKNDFIATITHELKTPLASTRMLVDTLLAGKYSDEKTLTDYLAIISRENERLCSLIDNFLNFSRMDRGKVAFDRCEISVNALIDQTVELFNHKNENNIIFSVTKLNNDVSIYADSNAMQTVLLNLLSNAYKYSTNCPKEIELLAEYNCKVVRLAVKDNGIGLNPAQQKRIFDRFWRADNTLARQTEGTGIGLSIVKYILDAHGFEIEVNSKPGAGSEFVVKISI